MHRAAPSIPSGSLRWEYADDMIYEMVLKNYLSSRQRVWALKDVTLSKKSLHLSNTLLFSRFNNPVIPVFTFTADPFAGVRFGFVAGFWLFYTNSSISLQMFFCTISVTSEHQDSMNSNAVLYSPTDDATRATFKESIDKTYKRVNSLG